MSGLSAEDRIRRAVEIRIAELVSSGGITFSRAALEILYLLPPDFVAVYTELFHQALKGADGGSDARGQAAERTRDLGRASGKATRSTGSFRGVWTIGDERALALKDRADKRLRSIARDTANALGNLKDQDDLARLNRKREKEGKKLPEAVLQVGDSVSRLKCQNRRCNRFLDIQWLYCPSCGTRRKS